MTDAAPSTVGSLLPLLSQGPTGFAAAVGGWVLIGQVPDDAEDSWVHRTRGAAARAVRAATGEVEALLDVGWAALPLKKRPGNVFPETIFVGRAANNDVCVPHSSVSKVHARARYGVYGLIVQDAGSSNGTMLNGENIGSGVDASVSHGDLLRFGNVVFQCFEPERLHAVLLRFQQAR